MTAVILDASAAVAWLLEQQATSASDAMLLRIAEFQFSAPFVFDWEVHNVLMSAARSSPAFHHDLMDGLAAFDVSLEPPIAAGHVLELADRAKLSLFDAAYLLLAIERESPLMSRDGRLLAAASSHGVEIYDLR